MKLLKTILPLVSLLMLMGCGPGGSSFRIKGTLIGQEGGEIYVYNTEYGSARFDTIRVDEGHFVYGGSISEVTPYILLFPNAMEQVVFAGPGEVVEYSANVTNLSNYTVDGNKENELMTEFRKKTEGHSEEEIVAEAKQFIKSFPESAVSYYLEDVYIRKNKKKPTNLPDMTLKSRDDKNVKLWSGKESQYTLTVYWATWMLSSYEFMNRIRSIRAQHSDKNDLRIVVISLDVERYRWQEETRRDSTNNIEHYCDGKAWESPSITSVGISTVPSYFITNAKHKILHRGTDADQMGKDVDGLL